MKRCMAMVLIAGFFFTGVDLSWADEAGRKGIRIVGGEIVEDPAAYPWMVCIAEKNAASVYDGRFCGGALIHPNWVLTAGHCVKDEWTGVVESPDNIHVVLGRHDLIQDSGGEVLNVKTVIPHPFFLDADPNTADSDIALLELETPSAASTLPVYTGDSRFAEKLGTVIGWGNTGGYEAPPEPNPEKLRHVTMDIVSDAVCEQNFLANDFGIPWDCGMLCAGAPGKDSCSGDSGGPLILSKDGLELLVGLVSFGTGDCAEPGTYGVYARTSEFGSFIYEHVPHPSSCTAENFLFEDRAELADAIAVIRCLATEEASIDPLDLSYAIQILRILVGL